MDSSVFSHLARSLKGELLRSRDNLVPPAFSVLWEMPRFLTLYGGRASGKSWSIARVLLVLASEQPLRMLCCREIQGSIRESAYRLLADQIQALQLDDFFDVQADNITGRNGSRIAFEGLKYNASRIRSYEGVDICWVEEAQAVSELSWETLLPTIRKPGSRFFISFNPVTPEDPVYRRFVETPPPGCIPKKVSYQDNPYLSPEVDAERKWLEATDSDAYRHVWLGEFRTVSDALILRGKFFAEDFAVRPAWAGPYHGLDYGFSRDPSAAVRCYIDDETRTLYVDGEFWQLGADIDALPGVLESAIPGISRHVVYADSARPESTSYLSRNGIPNARSAEKWPGSVDDGIAYLRSFSRIVVNPECKHFLDECRSYSFKTDRLTGAPLPEPLDKNNHLIDALRYALSPLIKNLPAGGYLNRAALLVNGEAVSQTLYPDYVFVTAAICERAGTAVGFVFWSFANERGWPLLVLDYQLVEVDTALVEVFLRQILARGAELRKLWKAIDQRVCILAEEGELFDALAVTLAAHLTTDPVFLAGQAPPYDLVRVDSKKMAVGLDQRMAEIRSSVNGGGLVKFGAESYARQVTHRSVTANHLVAQLLSYRPGQRDAAQELVAAFALGCLTARDSSGKFRLVQKSEEHAEGAPAPAPAPAARPRHIPGVRLTPGWHCIEGKQVLVQDAVRQSDGTVLHPLAPGRYVIDEKVRFAR